MVPAYGAPMTDLAAFLNWLLPVRLRAEEAIHNGDAEPRPDLSPHADPVTGDLPPVPIGAGSARAEMVATGQSS